MIRYVFAPGKPVEILTEPDEVPRIWETGTYMYMCGDRYPGEWAKIEKGDVHYKMDIHTREVLNIPPEIRLQMLLLKG